ncbi:nucleoside-diphosphate-sugar epimerase [Serpentinimonas maccroryi]|uniref:Nucleoside-diphosphate-sugar epimerase n=1 Tax=Serpentinimonas maccroryi TaxID=1458426 RepID=A0A060NJZ2_9BURK|nr:SDR family oxidoreductase [Serpentinimonas maccroryi]BAO82711.1 nucleoside-diphosphate-sugar epimerase [Serpentinimonas maccroryi]
MTMLLGALPARFRRERVLIVGCGDVGLRCAALLRPGRRVLALTSSPERVALLRAQGVVPLLGNLDDRASLQRLAGLATRVLYLAPPPNAGTTTTDPRSRALAQALGRRSRPRKLVYGSTSGVYGDCAGAWVSETRPPQPSTARGQRRLAAERTWRNWGRWRGVDVSLLRIPGIYGGGRAGGARERLLRGTPVLCSPDDVYTNHIHADDLARACVRALWWHAPQRSAHVCDDSTLRMGDYFDLAADLYGLPRPPRISRAEATAQLGPMLLSFMSESRRLHNQRLKRELRLVLRYPTPQQGLLA